MTVSHPTGGSWILHSDAVGSLLFSPKGKGVIELTGTYTRVLQSEGGCRVLTLDRLVTLDRTTNFTYSLFSSCGKTHTKNYHLNCSPTTSNEIVYLCV